MKNNIKLDFDHPQVGELPGPLKGRGGEGSGPKFLIKVFEITVDPKTPASGPTFLSGLEAPDPMKMKSDF